jgi:hypothetical protein
MSTCKKCNNEFEIIERDRKFYERINVPEPKGCPECRRQLRLAHWAYGIFQKRKCDLSGETIISPFSEKSRFPVYKRSHWHSDKWDPPEQEIDFTRPFFDQFYELQSKTPHFHQVGKNNTNCDYADDVWESKNAYLSRAIAGCEDVYYTYRTLYSKSCFDITYCYDMEQSYECTYCFNCYNLKLSSHCWDCSDSYFLYDCKGTRNSFMCWNLRNKQYCIQNEQYTKEQYEKKLNEFGLDSRKSLAKLRKDFLSHTQNDAIHRDNFNVNIQNCQGNYLTNSKNCTDAFLLEDAEDCSHVFRSPMAKNSMDLCGLFRGELCYEVTQTTDSYNVQFANYCFDCNDSQYVDQCANCSNLFGCVGLKRKQFCILNKQYSEEEYKQLRIKLIEHMKETGEYGEFFPYKFAYNGFNLSLGSFYYNETEESIREKGGFFEKEQKSDRNGIDAESLPDKSEEATDEIIGKAVNCAVTKKTYNFVKQELDFYRQHKLPLPKHCPEYRNTMRYLQLIPFNSREIKCHNCGIEITTYYPEKWGFKKIYCHDCYKKEIY